jgi:hypothetical protein
MSGATPPLPQHAFMALCSVKAQGQLYLYIYVFIACYLVKHRDKFTSGLSREKLKNRGNKTYPPFFILVCCESEVYLTNVSPGISYLFVSVNLPPPIYIYWALQFNTAYKK